MARNARYFGGIGKGTVRGNRITVFDSDGKVALTLDRTPAIASNTLIHGEPIVCAPNGETMELDNNGPVHVADSNEKMAYYKKTGCMPAPEHRFGRAFGSASNPKGGELRKKRVSFGEHFQKEHGITIKQYLNQRYGTDA